MKKKSLFIIALLLLQPVLPAHAGNKAQATRTVTTSTANWQITSSLPLGSTSNSYQLPRNSFQANGNDPDSLFFTLTNVGSVLLSGFSLRIRQAASPITLTLQGCASPWTLGTGTNKGKDNCSSKALTFSTINANTTDSTFAVILSGFFAPQAILYMRASVPKNTNRDYSLDVIVSRSNVRLGAVTNS